MTMRALILSGVVALSGCASGSGGEGATDREPTPAPSVELIVRNERQSTLTAFVQWRNGNATRLGEIPGGATRTYTTPFRGTEVRVFFASPGAAGSGDTADRSNVPYSPADPGDQLEWTLHGDGSVFYRRVR